MRERNSNLREGFQLEDLFQMERVLTIKWKRVGKGRGVPK